MSTTTGTALAADDTAQLFARADAIKMTDNTDYIKLIEQLQKAAPTLSDADKWHLIYLQGWQTAYVGQNDKARQMLETVIKQTHDNDLREQARATLINILGIGHHYETAFATLDQAMEELPQAASDSTRQHVLAEASQLLTEAGQYDLAIDYADQLILIPAKMNYACMGTSIKLDAEFRKGPHDDALLHRLQQGVEECTSFNHTLSADTLRTDIAAVKIEENKSGEAITLLKSTYAGMLDVRYKWLIAQYDALLAEAYWKQNNALQAKKYALSAVDIGKDSDFVEPLSRAYRLLYQIARKQGNLRDALQYHEKFLSTDKTHLDEVHEMALAYQVAKQQMEAKKTEIDQLSKQNEILQLQQTLNRKAVQSSHLYIALLSTVLASIAFLLYRLKQSQLRFQRLARRDGLTGILNRQHFIEEAERSLRYTSKSMRCASLILIDLDHFKMVNDTHGHSVGDHVLRRAVTTCQRHLQSCDLFGRFGGEEFSILLPECIAENAVERAEKIRLAINSAHTDGTCDIQVTASFGIASTAHHGHDLHMLLQAADEALYRAKRDGRNRVRINIPRQDVDSDHAARDEAHDATVA